MRAAPAGLTKYRVRFFSLAGGLLVYIVTGKQVNPSAEISSRSEHHTDMEHEWKRWMMHMRTATRSLPSRYTSRRVALASSTKVLTAALHTMYMSQKAVKHLHQLS